MKSLKGTLCAFMAFWALSSYAQDWREMIQNEHPNFAEIQASFYAEFGDSIGPKGSGWKQFKRWEYYWESRLDENGNIPDPAERYQIFQAYEELQNAQGKYAAGTGNWSELGPVSLPNNGTGQPNGMGRINCIAFHPTDANTLYAGAASGGFWISTDNGATWSKSITGLTRLGVSSIVVHPTSPNIIYIGTGDRDGGDAPGYGVWRSTDGGATWAAYNTGMGNRTVYEILMDPTNSNRLIASTNGSRIYRSLDGGATWNFSSGLTNAKDIAFKPGDPNTIYAAGTQFSYSTDGGLSFTLNGGIPSVSRYAIGVTAANANYVYLIGGNGSGLTGIHRSTNSGVSFTTQATTPNLLGYATTGGTGSQAWYDLVMAADPSDANTVYIGGINNWKSTDGGVNWTIISHWVGSGGIPAVHADQHVLEFSPHNGALYNGHDGGIHITADGGTTWTEISSGLGIAQVYKLGVSQSAEGTVINGYQDNGTGIYYNGTWSTEIGGDGMECIIDPTDANYMYGALYYGDIRRSTNNGTNFSGITGSITETGAWVTPYILDPNNANNMFAGYRNVWRSTDVKAGTPTWTQISTFTGTSTIRTLAMAPSNSNVLYVGRSNSSERFLKTTNASAGTPTWTNLTGNLPVNSNVKAIAIDYTDENHLFIAIGNDIYESTDGGLNWTNYSGTLPNISLNTIVIDENSSLDAMYVGHDVGVYYRDNTMADWTLYSSGLPNVEITELEIYQNPTECKSKLYASSYGQGLWVSDLKDPGNTAPAACFEASTEEVCGTTTVQFTDLSDFTPTGWTWSISPTSFNFVGGTNANSQNPQVSFTGTGFYTVQLTATNAHGSDVESKVSYINVLPSTVAPSFNEDFESVTNCATTSNCGATICGMSPSLWKNLTNGTDDNIDWRPDEGGTPSANTGPTVDFSPGTATGNYAYTEASSCSGNTAILEATCILLDVDYTFDMGYHMFGGNMGTLSVELFDGINWTTLTTISGDQGNAWQTMSLDLSAWTGTSVSMRIRGVTGGGFESDIAIDAIEFNPTSGLPVELVEFNAENIDDRQVALDWTTSTEQNADHYIVQRAKDLSVWEDVAEVDAVGNTTETTKYETVDKEPYVGLSYYRLKAVDTDGSYEYSTVRSVNMGMAAIARVFPNPVHDGTLIVSMDEIEKANIRILSAIGQPIIVNSNDLSSNEKAFEVGHFSGGVYFVEIEQDGRDTQRIRFVVQ
ncbi:MAG: T9SS type A sorting domain-containing protein [bacterium]|nr:T9SS type A sorting domain-containing protein [bacterium]